MKDPRIIAEQLRQPSGTLMEETALQMNEANGATNLAALKMLDISESDHILEVGPGNGKFVADILKQGSGVRYLGIDWSEEIVAAANTLNTDFISSGRASFKSGTSASLPCKNGEFDKALSVHTIYFWDEPQVHLSEIKRVLVPGGKFCLVFGDRAFMQNLSFTNYGFRLYDEKDACEQLAAAGFTISNRAKHFEKGKSNTGEVVEKLVNIIVCTA